MEGVSMKGGSVEGECECEGRERVGAEGGRGGSELVRRE